MTRNARIALKVRRARLLARFVACLDKLAAGNLSDHAIGFAGDFPIVVRPSLLDVVPNELDDDWEGCIAVPNDEWECYLRVVAP